jgi:putative membrane protein
MLQHQSLAMSIVHVLLTGVSVLLVGKILPGVTVKSYGSAVLFAFIVGILDVIAWTFLAPLTVSFSVLTLGVGLFVINGLLFMIADAAVPGVQISGCLTAALASVGVTVINWVMRLFLDKWAP